MTDKLSKSSLANKTLLIFLWIIASLFVTSGLVKTVARQYFLIVKHVNISARSFNENTANISTSLILNIVAELLFFALLMIGNRLFFHIRIKLATRRFAWGLLYVLPICLFLIGNSVQAVNTVMHTTLDPTVTSLSIIFSLIVGLTEETAFRGIMLGNLLKHSNKSLSYYFVIVLVQGFFFGGLHLVNLGRQTFSVTFSQVIYASAIGIIFGVVYTKTGSLIITILAHALIDALAFIADPSAILAKNAATVPSATYLVMGGILLFMIAYAALTILLADKSKMTQIWQ